MTKLSKAEQLAQFFRARPGQWLNGETLARYGGTYAWRTRVSDLRRPPFAMTIENRQRAHFVLGGEPHYTVSEYRYVPTQEPHAQSSIARPVVAAEQTPVENAHRYRPEDRGTGADHGRGQNQAADAHRPARLF